MRVCVWTPMERCCVWRSIGREVGEFELAYFHSIKIIYPLRLCFWVPRDSVSMCLTVFFFSLLFLLCLFLCSLFRPQRLQSGVREGGDKTEIQGPDPTQGFFDS